MRFESILLGSFVTVPTWIILHQVLFPSQDKNSFRPLPSIFLGLFLIALQTLLQYSSAFLPTPVLLVLTYFLIRGICYKQLNKIFLVQTTLSYLGAVVLGVLATLITGCIRSLILLTSFAFTLSYHHFLHCVKAIVQIVLLFLIVKICRHCRFDLSPVIHRFAGPLIALYCFYSVGSYTVIRLLNLKDNPALGRNLIFDIIISFLFALFWARDKLAERRENARIALELNNTLIANGLLTESIHAQETLLHRYRKLVPGAGVFIGLLLDRLSRRPSDPAVKQDVETFHAQYADMQREMGIDAEMEIIRGMNYGSCGHFITDGMIYGLMAKAVQKNIHVLYYPHAPLTALEGTVSLNRAGNAVGDLLSNAIHWAEAGGSPFGRILLHMEQVDGIFVVSAYDNGPPFPLHVLDSLGRRGVTTRESGSGNGLPDIMEMLLSCGGSLDIVELPPDDLYTKVVRLRFDGEGLFSVESGRAGAQRCLAIREMLGASADKIKA